MCSIFVSISDLRTLGIGEPIHHGSQGPGGPSYPQSPAGASLHDFLSPDSPSLELNSLRAQSARSSTNKYVSGKAIIWACKSIDFSVAICRIKGTVSSR